MPREPDRLNERKAHSQHLQELGFSKLEIFEKMVSDGVMAKEAACANRCPTCWHDKGQRCICAHIPPHNLSLRLNVKVLVLMHHKEYLSAGDDAKLLLAALPESQSDLFVFGRSGDWLRLAAELAVDPVHTLLLWPGDGATTVDAFIAGLPTHSPWRAAARTPSGCGGDGGRDGGGGDGGDGGGGGSGGAPAPAAPTAPLLRVLVLDGVYGHARSMFRHMRKELPRAHMPQHVALHPSTLSVYHRAQQSYARDSAASVAASSDPDALRICTVEAFALLLEELGETGETTKALVRAVVVNNEALVGGDAVRPDVERPRSTTSGRAKRRQWRERRSHMAEQDQQADQQAERKVTPPHEAADDAQPDQAEARGEGARGEQGGGHDQGCGQPPPQVDVS